MWWKICGQILPGTIAHMRRPGRDGLFWKWSVLSRNQARIRDVPRGPVREEKRVGGEQSPIDNKGKQSTGTSTPLIFLIDSFN